MCNSNGRRDRLRRRGSCLSRRSARSVCARGGGLFGKNAQTKSEHERGQHDERDSFHLAPCPDAGLSKHGRFVTLTTRIINDLAGFRVSVCKRGRPPNFNVAIQREFTNSGAFLLNNRPTAVSVTLAQLKEGAWIVRNPSRGGGF